MTLGAQKEPKFEGSSFLKNLCKDLFQPKTGQLWVLKPVLMENYLLDKSRLGTYSLSLNVSRILNLRIFSSPNFHKNGNIQYAPSLSKTLKKSKSWYASSLRFQKWLEKLQNILSPISITTFWNFPKIKKSWNILSQILWLFCQFFIYSNEILFTDVTY